ncbi:MAG: hypothetical protein A4E35_00781 [Methanoregula sp. PtaU1.Bin051]|nr:MAG: hypothetical protein A4E35_00781 [Methanoregula sp. PtaU1.Bin051]
MPMPFAGKEFSFTQPDGKKIKVRGWGNQHYAVFEDLKGFSIVKDPKTGFYQYAKLSKDGKRLEPSGAVVGVADPKKLSMDMHLRIPKQEAKRQARAAPFLQEKKKTRWQERREEARAKKLAAPKKRGVTRAPPGEQRTGNYTGLCLLIQFPDVAGTITQAEVDDFCNLQGYNQNGNNGSVYGYFNDVSGGKFLYNNIVTAYYTAQHPRAYYTDTTIQYGTRARELITEALNDLIANGFNFAQLSADNTNHIYAVNAFYAGPCVNNWSEGLWPHSWYLEPQVNCGNNRIAMDYQITDMGNVLTLATFCHENGHMVCDFPDLYDYGYESFGAGDYCLMASGGPVAGNPTQVGAYLKYKAGWADKVTALVAGNYLVDGTINDFLTYSKSPTEYFIIENRIQGGRDAALPDAGLAIWHVDENGSNDNEQMTAASHYECALEQADGFFNLEHDSLHNGNPGDATDLYGAPSDTAFGAATMPGSNWWDGTASALEITNISVPGQTMTLTVGGGGAGCDLYLRDNLQDDGTEPLASGGISCSPDIIVYNQQLADPVGDLGSAAAMQNNALGQPVEAGQDNYIYLRVTNRGAQPGGGTARVFWSEVSALPTPASWHEITDPQNPAVIPVIGVPGVGIVGPITWDSASIPGIGHYCFIGLIDAPGDPAPDPSAIHTLDNYYSFIRESNNATWKNFNVTDALPDSVQDMEFKMQGWPRTRLYADLMIDLTQLPPGMAVMLRILKRVSEDASLKNAKIIRETDLYRYFKVTEGKQAFLRNLKIKPSDKFGAMLQVTIPKGAPDGNYQIAVAEIIDGREMGRVTQMYAVKQFPYIGNRKTREIHENTCNYAAKIGKKNRAAISDLQQALRHGYDGCRFCLAEYNKG